VCEKFSTSDNQVNNGVQTNKNINVLQNTVYSKYRNVMINAENYANAATVFIVYLFGD
jgi:hypothetical protein